jgi:predicted AlkP superfamily pyrophosphatase or phosphodiesterase
MKNARVFRLCLICFVLYCHANVFAAEAAYPFGNKHVLVIGIDGCRSDALQAAKIPNLRGLIENGTVCYDVFAGGKIGAKTQQTTVSFPGWASILTGVWVDKHNIPDNDFKTPNLKNIVDGKNVGYPHFFTRIKEKHPNCYLASIVNWKPINDSIVTDADHIDNGSDGAVAQKCAALLLGKENPAVIFLQFDNVDHGGHSEVYGPASPGYMKTIEIVDAQIGGVLDALHKRPNYDKEDWLILVTADHGGLDKKHGGQTPEERTVFIIASGGGYPAKVLKKPCGITVIPPTVFRHLGIPVDPKWGWEDGPFGVPPVQ